MKRLWIAILVVVGLLGWGGASCAADVSAGVYAHDVRLMGQRVHEGGTEAVLTLGSDPIRALSIIGRPSVYLTGAVNMQGKTDFAAAGLRWKVDLGRHLYVKLAGGVAVNDAPTRPVPGRIWEQSNVTFAPEGNVGWRFNKRFAVEASIIHMSNARAWADRNPGINELGVRAVVHFN